jgi:hypothetical protein
MMILLELIGWIILFFFFSFPVWINGNWKTIFDFDKDLNKYLREKKKKLQIKIEQKNKICTQYQPFKIDDKTYVICNFICDGDCQFKGMKHYVKK